jgi:hypothetical protein
MYLNVRFVHIFENPIHKLNSFLKVSFIETVYSNLTIQHDEVSANCEQINKKKAL